MGFAESFNEAYNKTAPVAAAGAYDLLKEKIKANGQKSQSDTMIDIFSHKQTEDIIKSGGDPDQVKNKIKEISKQAETMKKADFSPEHVTTMMKALDPSMFESDVAKAIKEQTLQNKKNINESTILPEGLTTLSADSSDMDKADFLSKINPKMAEIVKGISDYSLDPSKVSSMRTGEREAIIAATKMYDPSFNMQTYPQRQKFVTSFYDPNTDSGKSIVAIKQVTRHLYDLSKNAEALNSGKIPLLNKSLNILKREASDNPDVTALDTNITAVNEELTKAWAGNNNGERRVEEWKKSINSANSPDKWKAAIGTAAQLLNDAKLARESDYEFGTGKKISRSILNPEEQSTLDSLKSFRQILGSKTKLTPQQAADLLKQMGH